MKLTNVVVTQRVRYNFFVIVLRKVEDDEKQRETQSPYILSHRSLVYEVPAPEAEASATRLLSSIPCDDVEL